MRPKCRDSILSEFFGINPSMGIFRFVRACLHMFSCFLLPLLFKIIPTILELRGNFANPSAVAAIERAALLASKTKTVGAFSSDATWCVLAKFVFPPNPSY